MTLNDEAVKQHNSTVLWSDTEKLDKALSSCLVSVFMRMFMALLVTAIAAYSVVTIDALYNFVYGKMAVFYGLIIGEIVLVLVISFAIEKLSVLAANALFFFYAIVNGLTLSVIFLSFEITAIYAAFAITALMFVAIASFGAVTRKDLSSIGSLCIMGLFGVIIATIVNIFLKSSTLDFIISYVGIVVFVGLTAYDTQRIKKMLVNARAADHQEAIKKIAVIGALTLYLDFINLFLKILSLFRRR